MTVDLKLDSITHDLDFSDTDLQLVSNGDYVIQKIKIVLLFFFGEWFLDTSIGIKYWDSVFIKNPNPTLIDNLFKVAIVEVEEVNEILTFDSTYDSANRKYSLEASLDTTEGELNISQEVTI